MVHPTDNRLSTRSGGGMEAKQMTVSETLMMIFIVPVLIISFLETMITGDREGARWA